MKILVFGAGALGSFVGGLLSQKNSVTLIGREKHVSNINSKGLIIEGKTKLIAKPRAYQIIPNEKFELVLLTVKSYDTSNALEDILPIIDDDTILLSLQNGLGNLEKISSVCKKAIGGTTSHGITFLEPGRILHAGLGETTLGNFKSVERKELISIVQTFSLCGIETKTTDNILGELWAKAIINASINPITAITRLKNGYLLKENHLKEIMVNACKEGIEVARSANIKLPCYDIIEKTKTIARMTANNKSSMLQDIEKHKKTEIDSITGELIATARNNNVPIHTNTLLYNIIKGLEGAIGQK